MRTVYDSVHGLVINDPESVRDRLRAFLWSYRPEPNAEAVDLIEDLMFWHPDEFIDRLESVTHDCANVRKLVAEAHVGGRAVTPGLGRCYTLQETCQRA